MGRIPSPSKVKWWQYTFIIEAVAFIGTTVPIAYGIHQANLAINSAKTGLPVVGGTPSPNPSSGNSSAIVLMVCGLAWAIIFGVLKLAQARAKDIKTLKDESPQDLLGCTHVLYAVLKRKFSKDEPKPNDIRVTIHKVLKDKNKDEWFEQVIPYVGGESGRPGRKFPIECGIVGLTARTNEISVFERTGVDSDAYKIELKKNFGFTDEQLMNVRTDRYSLLAVPIRDDKNVVIGVVYLDSSRKSFFSNEEIQLTVLMACTGIARFLDERYK